MSRPITCPECGGTGELPADNEGDRPGVICDMCGGAGWGIFDPYPGPVTDREKNTTEEQ